MPNISQQYDNFQTTFNRMQKQKQYLNYGYTVVPNQSLEEKQEQLCKEVFHLADIQSGDVIVDVGFGSGEQDFLLAKMYPFRQLIGLNISQKQIDYANSRASIENLNDRMVFHYGKAEDMDCIADDSVDKVIAIECAFYFNRPMFYKEAARILKIGGYLVIADISFSSRLGFLTENTKKFRSVGTFSTNKKVWENYFKTKLIKNINHHTKQGAQESVYYILKNIPRLNRPELISWLQMALSSQLVALGLRFQLVEYHLIVLEKENRHIC